MYFYSIRQAYIYMKLIKNTFAWYDFTRIIACGRFNVNVDVM